MTRHRPRRSRLAAVSSDVPAAGARRGLEAAGPLPGRSAAGRAVVGASSYPEGREGDGCTGRVPTWRDGVLLTAEQKAALTPEQLSQYLDDSVVRDLAEIEDMPEPMRSRVRQMVESARARAEAQIAAVEGRCRAGGCLLLR